MNGIGTRVGFREVRSWLRITGTRTGLLARRWIPSRVASPTILLAWEGLLATLVLQLGTAYTSMFASRMGASKAQIGTLASLPSLVALFVLLPGALASERMRNRRRMVVLSVLALGACYFLASLSPIAGPARVLFLIACISVASGPLALYNVSWQAYFSDILPSDARNRAYATRTRMVFFIGIVAVLGVGLALARFPRSDGDRILMYQGMFFLAALLVVPQWRILSRLPSVDRNPPPPRESAGHTLSRSLRVIAAHRGFLWFLGASFFFHMAWQMSWPLFFLTQVVYLGSDESWLSLVSVSASLVQWMTVGFWSRFIERHGVRMTLWIGALGLAFNPLACSIAMRIPGPAALPSYLLLNLVNSLTFSAFQLAILLCLLEVIPEEGKTVNLSIYSLFTTLSNAVMPMVGVGIYRALGNDRFAMMAAMEISAGLRFLGALLFLLRYLLLRKEPDSGRLARMPAPGIGESRTPP